MRPITLCLAAVMAALGLTPTASAQPWRPFDDPFWCTVPAFAGRRAFEQCIEDLPPGPFPKPTEAQCNDCLGDCLDQCEWWLYNCDPLWSVEDDYGACLDSCWIYWDQCVGYPPGFPDPLTLRQASAHDDLVVGGPQHVDLPEMELVLLIDHQDPAVVANRRAGDHGNTGHGLAGDLRLHEQACRQGRPACRPSQD